jgi:hypothetical protein
VGRPYEQRDFTIGNVLGEALSLYRQFFVRFFSLGLIVFGTVDLIGALSTTASSDTGKGLWIIAGVIAALVGFFWLQGALVAQTEDVRDGRIDTTIGQVFARTQERLPYLVAAGFLVGALVAVVFVVLVFSLRGVGLLIAIVVVVFLVSRWFVTTPVIVLEHLGPVAALRRSWELVRGHGWRAVALILVTGILSGIVSSIVAAIVSAVTSGFLQTWLTSAVANAVTAPFLGLAWTLAYYHLRQEPEGAAAIPPGAAYTE